MSEKAYSRTDGKPVLVESVVLFLDLLGSSEIARSPKAQDYLITLDKAFADARKLTEHDPNFGPPRHHSSWFSDNLALAHPLEEDGESEIGSTIMVVSVVQLLLGHHNLFARGAIAVGLQYMDDELNFGPALVEAVELEKATKYPRVALDPKAIECCRRYLDYTGPSDSPWADYLLVEDESAVFVDYLVSAMSLLDDVDDAVDMIDDHRDHIEQRLRTHRAAPEVLAKYEWLAGYHNHACDEIGLPDLRIEGARALDLQHFGRP